MVSKKNLKNHLTAKHDKKQRFTIKKLSIGAASVLIGTTMYLGNFASANVVDTNDVENKSVLLKDNNSNEIDNLNKDEISLDQSKSADIEQSNTNVNEKVVSNDSDLQKKC